MILNDTEIELVRRFHESDLSETELNLIENRIDSESDFKEEVERLGLVRDTIVQLVEHQQGTDGRPSFLKSKGKKVKYSKVKWIAGLMIFFTLIAGSILYQQYFQGNKQEQIFAECENYTYSISSDIMRTDHSNTTGFILNEADKVFLERMIDSYKSGKLEQAEKQALSLKEISTDLTTQEIVSWWLVTIYLKKNDVSDAKATLNEISLHPDFNSKNNAIDILEEI